MKAEGIKLATGICLTVLVSWAMVIVLVPSRTELLTNLNILKSLQSARRILQGAQLSDQVARSFLDDGIPTLAFRKAAPRFKHLSAQKQHRGRTIQLDYTDPYHNEPYDPAMEQQEWSTIAASVRQKLGPPRTRQLAREEQVMTDKIWRQEHPYFYHAYGPKTKALTGIPAPAISSPSPAPSSAPSSGSNVVASSSSPSYSDGMSVVSGISADGVPATVLKPPDDGIRDFDGSRAVIARLPRLGDHPSELTETGKEVRGTFAVRLFGASGQPEIEVTRMGAGTPFKCDYRGFRRLSGDFAGNVVHTGLRRQYISVGGRILSGMTIGPTGDPLAIDVLMCRDSDTGEVQYFKIEPAEVLSRMPDDSTLA